MSLTTHEIEMRRRLCAEILRSETGIRVPDHRRALFDWELDQLGGGEPPSAQELQGQPHKLASLARSLAVAESYFFRHPEHFRVLEDFGRARATAGRPVRVLSAGCACGEEAWSAAAVLSGVMPRGSFRVDAWDLDSERLERARLGIYRQWSLRAGARGFEHLIRRRTGDSFEVASELRAAVDFRCVNLALELPQQPHFDVVFLRNVAIYWDRETAQRVLDRLLSRTAEDALLLLGPSDPVRPGLGWQVDRGAGAPTYRRAVAGGHLEPKRPAAARPTPESAEFGRASSRPVRTRTATNRPRKARSDTTRGARPPAAATAAATPIRTAATVIYDHDGAINEALDRAWALADQGRYGAALALLEAEEQPSARADKLRGVLSFHLQRIEEALQLLRRAVFLDPDDGDARRWLSVVWRQAGHHDHAERERRNADRLDQARIGRRATSCR